MKIYLSIVFTAFTLITSCTTNNTEEKTTVKKYAKYDFSMYPESNDTIKRHVIELPIEENEGLYNIEIWVGKTKKVDCNKHTISGKFTRKTVQGWGYSYYEFTTNNMHASTLMACPENTLTEKFIRSRTEHVRYNSKLPIIVYCPIGYEVEYAIWSKSEIPEKAKTK